jgi:membrane protease YdiL (CAAX protease family)
VRSHPYLSALLELGILFLPAIPAYLWVWPNLTGVYTDVFQVIVYLYFLAGTLFIGLRRWNWGQLGINRKGIGLTLSCGLFILVGRLLIILSIGWNVYPPPLTWLRLVASLFYYFGLVGLVEELVFRGLLYRLLEDWRGARWAIWGSSVGFLLWHVFGQGLLIGLATLLIGLLFALLRWRGGGILGLIVLHALWDLESALLVSDSNAAIVGSDKIVFTNPAMVWLGAVLLLLVPAYLGWLHPVVERYWRVKSGKADHP